ncbi:MAG TPA: hypothetical protein VIL74_07495 [Pyrinomonadaceae bacterium]|jgi:hypothetical protein
MLAINDKQKFNAIVSDSIEKVALTVDNERLARRWVSAIEKAADLVETQSEFITWQEEEMAVLVWSLESNRIYEANGVCQCEAYKSGVPCKHRALARLLKNYFGVKEKKSPKMEDMPYLKPSRGAKPTIIAGIRI